jgi:GTP cyclohydrolase IA
MEPTPNLAESVVRQMLKFIDPQPDREGLRETPARVVKAWKELFSGYAQDPDKIIKVFTDAGSVDEMVVQTDIAFTSFCEHHLLPFSGVAHVAYLPSGGKVVGLSKLARIVDVFARRLQVQERMTCQIADALYDHGKDFSGERWVQKDPAGLLPKGVGVVVEAHHGCMSCRGVKKSGTTTITSALRGAFKDDPATRAEFLSLTRSKR